MAKYEKLTVWKDPYDIMCDDCPVHEYTTWNEVTDEELHELFEMDKSAMFIDPYMPECPDSFEEWLKQNIEEGFIRIAR